MRGWVAFALAFSPALGAVAGESPAIGWPEANNGPQSARAMSPPAPPAAADRLAEVATEKRNPLVSIPLSALSETRDRPLFAVTRRPPPPNAVEGPAAGAAIVSTPSEPERAPFSLVGTIVGRNARVAILLDQATNRVMQLKQGHADSGWTVQNVGIRSIVLKKGDFVETVQLPRPNIPASVPRTGGAAR